MAGLSGVPFFVSHDSLSRPVSRPFVRPETPLFAGSWTLNPSIVRSRDSMAQGVADYQAMDSVFRARAGEIQALSKHETFEVKPDFSRRQASFSTEMVLPTSHAERKFDVRLALSRPLDEGTRAELVHYFARVLEGFILNAKTLMPEGDTTPWLPAKIRLEQDMLEACLSNRLVGVLSNDIQQIASFQYLNKMREALVAQAEKWECLPEKASISIASPFITAHGMNKLLTDEIPGFKERVGASSLETAHLEAIPEMAALYKTVTPTENVASLAGRPWDAHSRYQMQQVWMTVKTKADQEFKVLLGMIPFAVVDTKGSIERNTEYLRLYEQIDFDAFYKRCYDQARMWVELLKPSGWEVMGQKPL